MFSDNEAPMEEAGAQSPEEQPEDEPPVLRDPSLRPGHDGWTWPNAFPKASMRGRDKSLAELLGVKTVKDRICEPEWEPGWNQGGYPSFSEHMLQISLKLFSGSPETRRLAESHTMRRLLPIFERLTRQTQRDLLSVLHDPLFKINDVPKSHGAFLSVKTHALRMPLSRTFQFTVEIDGEVRFYVFIKL